MANYGLKFIREFTNVQDKICRVEFWFKDYVGDTKSVFGSRDSFVLAKQLDDPFEPVQAQAATIELLAEDAINFSIDDFYSEDDEACLVKFYLAPPGGTQRVPIISGNATIQFIRSGTYNLVYLPPTNGLAAGQQIEIAGQYYHIVYVDNSFSEVTALNVSETVTTRTLTGVDYTVYNVITEQLYFIGYLLQDETASPFVDYDSFISVTVSDNLGLLNEVLFDAACGTTDPYQHFTIAEYLKIILSATGLQLPIQIFANIYETTTTKRTTDATATFVDQTRLYSGCFADDSGKWQNCYDILSAILKAFGFIICQRKGAWVVYRWGELRTLDNAPFAGTQFNYDLTGKTAISLPNKPVIISEQRNPLIGGADNKLYQTRPYKSVKETFNYKQPAQLIKNLDLQQLGNLRNTSTVVRDGETITVKDYDAPNWYLDQVEKNIATNSYFIRVETDSNNVEITRYLVATTSLGDKIDYVTVTDGAYVNKGDKIKISISMRAPTDPGSNYYDYYLSIYDGTNRYWLSRGNSDYQEASWNKNIQTGIRTDYNNPGFNYRDWHSWGIDSLQIPVDGWLNLRLGIQDANGGETHWKDISLQYEPFINESTEIIGQEHTQSETRIIKNTNESDVSIDDSPRNLIAGSLLTNLLTNFATGNSAYWYPNPLSEYVTKTKLWQRNPFEEKKLGQIVTSDLKQIYSQLRRKLDCTFIFDDEVDNLTTFQIAYFGAINFRFAIINSINFSTCRCQAVLVEQWQSGEDNAVFNYEFKYLYKIT